MLSSYRKRQNPAKRLSALLRADCGWTGLIGPMGFWQVGRWGAAIPVDKRPPTATLVPTAAPAETPVPRHPAERHADDPLTPTQRPVPYVVTEDDLSCWDILKKFELDDSLLQVMLQLNNTRPAPVDQPGMQSLFRRHGKLCDGDAAD